MRTLRRLRLRLRTSDRGFALVLVIAIGAILMMLATVAVTVAVSGVTKSQQDRDWAGAASAAYAGIEEYKSRLANDTSYTKYGNPSDTRFGAGGTRVLPTGTQANPAFGIGPTNSTTGTWATVAGSNGTARYRYEVDNSAYLASGILRIRSTGAVGNATRSIIANLKQTGFINFVYFTNFETLDPTISSNASTCNVYAWAGRASSCTLIQFAAADNIQGDVHSNDTLQICGSTFTGSVTTGNTVPISGRLYGIPGGCAVTTAAVTNSPVIGLPATNTALEQETRSDLTGSSVPNPGCLYTGPTSITYNAGGTMTVRSPWTVKTNLGGDPLTTTSGSINPACGLPGPLGLGSVLGTTILVPSNNVVYVQDVPSRTTDPNYWGGTTPMPGTILQPYSCTGAGGVGVGNGIGYPISTEVSPASVPTPYDCRKGDVFVKGTLKGQQTVAATRYVYVVGDLTYSDAATDLLGLVGTNAVWVWNPINSSNQTLLTDSGREIDASILSTAHSFQVQNYNQGSLRGYLTVNGSIAQNFRGTVAIGGSTGYIKKYIYDPRLKFTAPPKFLSPVTTSYGVTTSIDTAAAFAADGNFKP
jgi:Tfp pilus assembly protein PilX